MAPALKDIIVLGSDIGAEDLYILTDVPEVYLHFHTARQESIRHMSERQAQTYLADGHFPPGSMGPKIEAALHFLHTGGHKVIVTNIETIELALTGAGGTTIHV